MNKKFKKKPIHTPHRGWETVVGSGGVLEESESPIPLPSKFQVQDVNQRIDV